jgi:hypothetical protein
MEVIISPITKKINPMRAEKYISVTPPRGDKMKSSLQHLRRFIRESILQHESYGKHAKKVVKHDASYARDPRGQAKALEKYHTSESWSLKANYALRNIPSNIWIIPAWRAGEGASSGRVQVLDIESPAVHRHILESGIGLEGEGEEGVPPEEQIQRVREHLQSGGSLIISISHIIQKDFWPSPWNLLHALADDDYNQSKHPLHRTFLRNCIQPAAWALNQVLSRCRDIAKEARSQSGPAPRTSAEYSAFSNEVSRSATELYESFLSLLVNGMTMGSARRGSLFPEQGREFDIVAESVTQAITRPGGFQFKLTDVSRALRDKNLPLHVNRLFKDSLKEYLTVVNSAREPALKAIGNLLRHNVVAVNVVDLPYEPE